ncbi:preprotein translocase subunit SecF [Candidatus Pacearchaeota archaeon]|nr:preprotein translocase subunit SecF [Candidatus Pacearchaeota archaeon]|tara:strand:+ start:356 stop:1255 length:900 start_codon:yes stop_codon:yes gene_type:complete
MSETQSTSNFEIWYNKNYKLLLIIPLALLLISLAYLGYSYQQTGDFIEKDITLTGGTSITLVTLENSFLITELKNYLSEKTTNFAIKEITDLRSGKQKAVIIESPQSVEELKPILEGYLGYKLNNENSSIESTGSSLGESFYNQLRLAIVISFIFMALVVFFLFRSFTPSFAVVISAFADIIMTLALVNFLGMKVSSAGITAVLMLIGYSVDSDIMLTTRLLKRQGELNKNLSSAFKTGMTMTLTSIIALSVALFITQSFSIVLSQIFTILLIGLGFDILNTWTTNASILKWYMETRHK